jgi:hypothetical protein
MCELIVDANVASLVFGSISPNDFTPIQDALFGGRAVAVYGGTKLTNEYLRLAGLRRILRELDRKGALRKVANATVDGVVEQVVAEGRCCSDDPHVIALARSTGVRLLCSHDRGLHADFTNPAILRPRGSVYQRRQHSHLLREHCE